jgi:hypothetical protein
MIPAWRGSRGRDTGCLVRFKIAIQAIDRRISTVAEHYA